ncbi:protein LBH-like isoform X2 [Hemiscyllium ocellatum]|uniref:protein LBH-like isoform X2 n=1 Tax=Hemiscyllium ocellatum TaxID=170820 RepID=UPI002965E2F2|nr:protein LBH-like isoform X2 [Hemiscyllium ocellatum]
MKLSRFNRLHFHSAVTRGEPHAAPLTQESAMENVSLKEKVEHLPVQIFPDPLESADEGCRRIKGRLPSITVELTDASEVESGELRWPPPEASAKPDAPGETQPGPSEAAPAGEDEAEQKEAETERGGGAEAVSLPQAGEGGVGVGEVRN